MILSDRPSKNYNSRPLILHENDALDLKESLLDTSETNVAKKYQTYGKK